MKFRIIPALALLAASAVVPALADGFGHPANNEAGSFYHGPEYRLVEGRLVRTDEGSTKAVAPERPDRHWTFDGSEAGWALTPHAYRFDGGRMVHADPFRHDTPRPSVANFGASDPYLYSGS
jgi:hypothetical protein